MFLSLSSSVMAEEAPVDKMFRVMSMDKQIAGGFEAMLPVIDQMTAELKLDSEGKEELRGIFRSWFNEDIDRAKILNEVKALYTQTFTSEEIAEITEFYQTPIGKKFLEKSAQLMQLGAQIGMKEAQVKQVKLMERVKPFMEKHGVKH
jgi:uncharacterized protein